MSQLNAKPDVSKDRLQRVMTRGYDQQQSIPEEPDTGPAIARHNDVAILVKRGSMHTFVIGRVLRIRNHGSRGKMEYKRPISLNDRDQYDNVKLVIREYTPQRRRFVYNTSLSVSLTKEYSIKAVIMPVTMCYVPSSKIYSLEPSDKEQLNQFITDKNKVSTQKLVSKCKPRKTGSQCMEDDGMQRQRVSVPGKRTRIVRTFTN